MKPFQSTSIKSFLSASLLLPVLAATPAIAQDAKPSKTEKTAANSEAILRKLSGLPAFADAKVINIHIGDNLTFGFDEGIDAEEWGMTENNNDAGAAGAKTTKPGAKPTPEKPQGFRKIDFRKGDLILVASEEPAKEVAPALAAQPEPAVATTTPEAAPASEAPAASPSATP
jgi:hypothetical protein